jgi:hypothetical protein
VNSTLPFRRRKNRPSSWEDIVKQLSLTSVKRKGIFRDDMTAVCMAA